MKILVSACLLGENCKYSGGNNYNQAVCDFADRGGLARTVGSEQAVNRPLGNRERHIVQSRMSGEALGNVFYFQYLHNRSKT